MRESLSFLLIFSALLALVSVCTTDAFVAPLIVVVLLALTVYGLPGRKRIT